MKHKRVLKSVLVAFFLIFTLSPVVMAMDGKININTAPLEELMKLKNIGQVYAERIIQYREQNGPFQNPEDITKVKGIGSKIYEINKDQITVK